MRRRRSSRRRLSGGAAWGIPFYNDVEILRAIAEENYVYGNLVGLTDKTGLGRDLVSNRLTVLKNLGIIETRISDKNVLHWYVSPRASRCSAKSLPRESARAPDPIRYRNSTQAVSVCASMFQTKHS